MADPMWTVVILAVLWLIVVVPMVLQRQDTRAGRRSVARFSSAMRALASRRAMENTPPVDVVSSPIEPSRAIPSVHVSGAVTRHPVPAAKESLMLPPDRQQMSEARRQMLTRRRRSLAVLTIASVVFLLAAAIVGGTALWVLGALAIAALAGYLLFLRMQARRDRARRETRRARSASAVQRHATSTALRVSPPESVVRIDEEDIALDHLDTVDLTGLYSEVELQDTSIRRAG